MSCGPPHSVCEFWFKQHKHYTVQIEENHGNFEESISLESLQGPESLPNGNYPPLRDFFAPTGNDIEVRRSDRCFNQWPFCHESGCVRASI